MQHGRAYSDSFAIWTGHCVTSLSTRAHESCWLPGPPINPGHGPQSLLQSMVLPETRNLGRGKGGNGRGSVLEDGGPHRSFGPGGGAMPTMANTYQKFRREPPKSSPYPIRSDRCSDPRVSLTVRPSDYQRLICQPEEPL